MVIIYSIIIILLIEKEVFGQKNIPPILALGWIASYIYIMQLMLQFYAGILEEKKKPIIS